MPLTSNSHPRPSYFPIPFDVSIARQPWPQLRHFFFFSFLRFSSRVYSIRRPRKSEKRGGEMEIREGITRVYRRKAVKRILFLPDLLHFRIRDDVSLWRGRRSVPNPEISVRSGPIVAESFYEYRRVVHRVYVPFDSMRVVLQFSDKFSVVIGSIVGVAYGTTGNN